MRLLMLYRVTCTGLTLSLLLTACSQSATSNYIKSANATEETVQNTQSLTIKEEDNITINPNQSFNEWLAEFKNYAITKGINKHVFDEAFYGVTPDAEVVKADRSQPEFTRPIWEYLDVAVSKTRITNGNKKIQEHKTLLNEIEQKYNVDQETVIAIWGMESGYGSFTGNKNVIRSLATLAYEGRRSNFAKEQLIAALKILQNKDVAVKDMKGSWAGAMGQTQFIPTTYLALAVDFDGDGHRNIWTSIPDALASTANYLQTSGWQYKEIWGHEVRLPKNFDYSQTDISTKKLVAEWANRGVTLANGQAIPTPERKLQAAIILPAGANGPAFIVYRNFFAIMKYNNSTSYALAVTLLSDNFKGKKGEIIHSWPISDKPLSRTERKELQSLLNQKGYNAGHADSIIGANTRQAIRDYQKAINVAADGYPSHSLLNQLRAN